MSKAVAKRSVSLGSNSTMMILGLAVIGILVYFLLKKQNAAATTPPAGTYQNLEKWSIKWDPETMLPLEIEVHRDAVRS